MSNPRMAAAPVSVAYGNSSEDVPVAGASQCQWSPWGSQPTDSVGDGPGSSVPVAASSCSSSDGSPVAVGSGQCLEKGECGLGRWRLDRRYRLPVVTMGFTIRKDGTWAWVDGGGFGA